MSASFSAITAYTQRSLTFSGDGDPERVEGASIARRAIHRVTPAAESRGIRLELSGT